MGRRHPPLHERSRRAHGRALRGAVPRARGGRHGEAVVAEGRRKLRDVFHAARRPAAACRDAARDRRRAPAFPSRAPAAARDPRAARDRRRAVRLHAARLPPDLPAIPPRHGGWRAIAASPTSPAAPRALPGGPGSGAWTSSTLARRVRASCCAAPSRVIAPSQDVAARMRRYLPDLAIEVWPHPEGAPGADAARRARRHPRQPVAGERACTSSRPARAMRASAACRSRFACSARPPSRLPQAPDAPLTIYGQYVDTELPQLIAAEKPDVLLFAAQVPETYAYTLVGGVAVGLAHRRVGAGRVSRAARRRRARRHGAVGRAAGANGTRRCSAAALSPRATRREARAKVAELNDGPARATASSISRRSRPAPRAHALPDALPPFDERHFYLQRRPGRGRAAVAAAAVSSPASSAGTRRRAAS